MTLEKISLSDELTQRHARFVTEELRIALHDDDTYRLDGASGTIGFARKQGNTFLALLGATASDVIPVGESLSFDSSVAMVVTAYRR